MRAAQLFPRGGAGRVVALVLAVLAITAGCSGGSGDDQTGYVAGDPGTTFVEPADRKPAPDLSGELLGGGTYAMGDERGDDILVVNVWAEWCAPCRSEAAALEEVYGDFRGKGVQFLGINTRSQESAALAFVAGVGTTYPSVVDDGGLQVGFNSSLPVAAIPTTYVIDRQGRVAARALSEVTYSRLTELVERVLAEDEPAGPDQ